MEERGSREAAFGPVRLDCVCGATLESDDEPDGKELDVRVECDDCARRYVLTVTRFGRLDRGASPGD